MPKHVPIRRRFKSDKLVLSFQFLADRTDGRAIATLLRLSVCDVMYCG